MWYLVKADLWNKYRLNSLTKLLFGVHWGLNHTNSRCGGSVWECVWRCVLPGRACICILLLVGVAPHAAFHRQKILYIHTINLKNHLQISKALIDCNHLPRILSHNTTVLQKVTISYWLQILGAPASPKDSSTYRVRYCMWVYSQAQRLQAEPHYCPISSPQALNPPPLPATPANWDASWLHCFH